MRFTTRTEYGLVCLVYMAKHPMGTIVSLKEVVRKERYSPTYIEKILQNLRAAKIIISHQGKGGGYSLARPPSAITFKEIVEALEGYTFDVFCEPNTRKDIVCTHMCMCGVRPVWRKTKELLDNFYSQVTLELLAREEDAAQEMLCQVTNHAGAQLP